MPTDTVMGMGSHVTPLPQLAWRRAAAVVVGYPFTTGLVVAMLLTSAAYGTLSGHPHADGMSFGLPALRDGRVWTYLIGGLIVPSAGLLPVAGGLVAVVVGALEHRVGARRTALTVIGTHLVGTVGASLFLWVASGVDWRWADGLARLSDTGLSAGGLGVLAVLTAFLHPPLRRAIRVGVGAYLVVILLRSGLLWDLEHLLSFGAGLVVGPWAAGRRRTPWCPRGSNLSGVRGGASLLLAATAATELVEVFFPGYGGPLGPGPVVDPSAPALATSIGFLVVALPLADGLRRGSALAWHVLLVSTAGTLVLHVAHLVTLGVGDVVLAATLLALAVWHHGAAGSRSRRPRTIVADLERRITTYGAGSLGWQNMWSGSESWATGDGAVALTYRPGSGIAIVVGDPVGPRARWTEAIEEFREFCQQEGLTPAWYAVGDDVVAASASHGWSSLQIGEDTVIALADLEFKGRSWQDVRTARNRAAKEGITMRTLHLHDTSPDLLEQVREISEAWVQDKPLPEMGFTLGGVTEALDPQVRTHVAVDAGGHVHGVTSWMPVHRDGRVVGWTLDLMRRRNDGFRPVMEFLIAESAMTFKDEGFESLSLSVAPLARRGQGSVGALDRVLDTASRVLEPTYGFRSLLGFKAKFDPTFRPVHLVYASGLDLPRISLAIGHAYLPELTVGQLGHLAGEIGRPMLTRAAHAVAPVRTGLEARLPGRHAQPVAPAADRTLAPAA
jgi:lysylphosphatidylglycerol synthetase-like protein (DUF2156 family)